MPRASHRLDLCLIVQHPLSDQHAAALSELAHSRELLEGGVGAHRVERGAALRFWANQQGGFRVSCPTSGRNIVPGFNRALDAWRAGGPRAISCPACGQRHDLAALRYAPAAAFGRSALVLCDVNSLQWLPADRAAVEAVLGPFTQVARRIG